jgi:hypothetical protein
MKNKKCKRRLHKKTKRCIPGSTRRGRRGRKKEEEHKVGEKEDIVLPLKSSKHSSTNVLTFIF